MMLAAGAVPACLNPTPYPTHYMFASQTVRILCALYAAFLAMMLAGGAVPVCWPGRRSDTV